MQRRMPTVQQVQRLTRARVCAACKLRTPGTDSFTADDVRPCESSCPLFVHLPVLREAGRCLDPMVGRRSAVLARIIRNVGSCRRCGPNRAAQLYGNRVVALVEELFGD